MFPPADQTRGLRYLRFTIYDLRFTLPPNRQSKIDNRRYLKFVNHPSSILRTSSLEYNPERGIALLIVVSVLTVIGIMGVAFAFSMYLETQATRQFVATTQARYMAEAGVSHGWALLDEDRLSSRVDDDTESWDKILSGSDMDVDRDGQRESRFWSVTDQKGEVLGRYALKITDEANKIHLDVTHRDISPLDLGAVDLKKLLKEAQIDNPDRVADAIEQYRYGLDRSPGVALVDDDRDGSVDEADEYEPLSLYGDDQRLEGLEGLVGIAGLDTDDLARLAKLATVYSWDLNISVRGQVRLNVNTATADELFSTLLEAGVEDPWQAAVNIADAADSDNDISHLSESSRQYSLTNQGALGSWHWVEDHYETDEPEGESLSWTVSVPTGTYQLRAWGVSGMKIGDLTLDASFFPSVDSGEYLGEHTFNGPVLLRVSHRGSRGETFAFKGIELIPDPDGQAKTVRGIEGVRVNELMIEPVMGLDVSAAIFDAQGSDWVCPLGSNVCSNSGVGQARWSWTNLLLQPGRYHLRLYGSSAGQTVGQVSVDGNSQLLLHGQRHPATVSVGSDHKITLSIGKTASEATYYIQRISLSRQPDAEYIEFINLTDAPVDASGWMIEGDAVAGRQAQLPTGSVIDAHGFLVAGVDLDDAQEGLSGNGIDARSVWEMANQAASTIVQLKFPGGGPSPDDDWLKVSMPPQTPARLIVRNGDMTVDEVEYRLPLSTTAAFQSLEKGDPSAIGDSDDNGIDDVWYPALQLYTPGSANHNDGMQQLKGEEIILHDPQEEIEIPNRPLEWIGQMVGLPSGRVWESLSSTDLAKVVDRLTVDGLRLEAEDHLVSGQDAWRETEGGYAYSSTDESESVGTWQWSSIPDGPYRMSLYGWPQEQMSVRWHLHDGSMSPWSVALSSDAQGRIVVGRIVIGPKEGTAANTLTLEVTCASVNKICHMDAVQLDPQLRRVGLVNINTAGLGVLRVLPGMTDTIASRVIAGRPYGDQGQKGRGIGDLLLTDALGITEEDRLAAFRKMAHLLTVRSDCFQIVAIGQTLHDDEVLATQRVQAIIQRSAQTDAQK